VKHGHPLDPHDAHLLHDGVHFGRVAGTRMKDPGRNRCSQRRCARTHANQRHARAVQRSGLQQGIDVARTDKTDQCDRRITFDELGGLLERIFNLVSVVPADKPQRVSPDAPLGIDPREIRLDAEFHIVSSGCEGAGKRRDLTDHDFGRRRSGNGAGECERKQETAEGSKRILHYVLSPWCGESCVRARIMTEYHSAETTICGPLRLVDAPPWRARLMSGASTASSLQWHLKQHFRPRSICGQAQRCT